MTFAETLATIDANEYRYQKGLVLQRSFMCSFLNVNRGKGKASFKETKIFPLPLIDNRDKERITDKEDKRRREMARLYWERKKKDNGSVKQHIGKVRPR